MANLERSAAPPAASATRRTINDQIKSIQSWAREEIGRLEHWRDEEVLRLGQALACLEDDERAKPRSRPGASPGRRRARARRRGSARASTTPAAVQERCEAVLRYLVEQDRALARGAISRALNLSPYTVRTALERLIAEGKAARVNSGPASRYRASGRSRAEAAPARVALEGTLQGRILATLQERGWATLEEIVQAVGASREEVLRECGALVRDEEVQMARREGRAVYVCAGAS